VGITVKQKPLLELLDEGTEAERLASGFTFTEGPIWHQREQALYFSDMPGDVRRRWKEGDGVTEVMRPSNKGNGMTFDADGNLLVCEHVTSSVVREHPDGRRDTLATHYQGKYLNSPNDLVVHSDGSVYFSDPTYGRMPVFGIERAQELGFQGVYRIPPGGGGLRLLVDDFAQPNGLCFSPDESLLYVNDTERALIRVFDVAADGGLAGDRLFASDIGRGVLAEGVVDGMKCDERGNVWVSGPEGVWVFSPSGEHLGVVEIPENVGNLHWGGDGWRDLFVCASTSLYRVRSKVAGRREPFMH
jgi:gluconolactonase